MSLRVQLIEDNEQNRYLLSFLLGARGHQVSAAVDGISGIRMAQTLQPDVILLDIQLPGMHGYDVAQRLRQIPELAHTPIIAVTSYAMPGDREKALAAGCDNYIEKPIDPETFVQDVERIVRELKS